MAIHERAHLLAALGSVTSSGPRSSPPPRVSLGYGSPGCTAGEAARDRFPEPRGVGLRGLEITLLRGAADRGTTGTSDTAGCAHSAVAATATRSGMPATWRRSKVRSSVSFVLGCLQCFPSTAYMLGLLESASTDVRAQWAECTRFMTYSTRHSLNVAQ